MEFTMPASLFQDFHFLRPLWLLALLPALVFFIALWRMNSSLSAWDRAIDKDLLPYLLETSKSAAQRTPLYLLLAAWILSTVALAGPVWEELPQPVQQREDALVIVMDLSLSMFAADHEPSRLDLAKRKLRDILALRNEGQTALIVYAGDAHTVTPLTDDVVTIASLVPSLSPNIMPLFGSNPVPAIQMAVDLLDEVEAVRGKILFMTDGIAGFQEEQRLVEVMEGSGYELLIMGIGTETGAPISTSDGGFLTDDRGGVVVPTLNRNVLQSLANRTGGRYHDIQLADSDLAYLLPDNELLDEEQMSEVEEEFDIWYEAGPYLLLLVLPIVAMSFRRGWLFAFSLVFAGGMLLPAEQAQAQGFAWQDLWKTPNQQAADAFEEERHEEAALMFENPEWAGAASYRAGDYEAAIASFAASDTADGHYNRGNALAMAGAFQEALAAYNRTLTMEPDHADALHNKEIVEQLIEQQENEEGEQQDGESQENQSEQNSENQSEQSEENNQQQDQESQEGNEEQQQQEQQQQQPPEDQENSESNSEQNTPTDTSNEEFEEQQSLEQWLRRIEDDPGELLRRKFRYQYRQRQLNGTANNGGGQIW
jgi:Ca-activated chloride channel family protein